MHLGHMLVLVVDVAAIGAGKDTTRHDGLKLTKKPQKNQQVCNVHVSVEINVIRHKCLATPDDKQLC